MTLPPTQTGYAPVNGLRLYYEIHGTGQPLILLHGGFGMTGMFSAILPQLAQHRQVIAVDLQAHGRTADIDRPLRCELLADDIAALITHLGLEKADVLGYSLGGGTALRTAIQHPGLVRKLVVVSAPFKRTGWYPAVVAQMSQPTVVDVAFMRKTPLYHAYVSVAPQPENFAALCHKMDALLRHDYDWSAEVAALPTPTLLVVGDSDDMPPAHAVAFFELLGGAQRPGGWDNAGIPKSRLAILPGVTHYNVLASPALLPVVVPFLTA